MEPHDIRTMGGVAGAQVLIGFAGCFAVGGGKRRETVRAAFMWALDGPGVRPFEDSDFMVTHLGLIENRKECGC